MKSVFLVRRSVSLLHFRNLTTLQSTVEIPDSIDTQSDSTSPIIRSLVNSQISKPIQQTQTKQQTIPSPHIYDVTHYLLFVSSYIAAFHNNRTSDFDLFLRKLEESWISVFNYIEPNSKNCILLHEISQSKSFEKNILNFKPEFRLKTFNLLAFHKSVAHILLELSDTLRKTKYFGVNEYEKLSRIIFKFGFVNRFKVANYNSEKYRYTKFTQLIEEMKSQSLTPSKQICLHALESLFHANANPGKITVPLMTSIIDLQPELINDPRVIILSSRVSGNIDVIQATERLQSQNCPVNENSIRNLLHGIIYGGNLELDSEGTYVPSSLSMKQAFQLTTNELLPYMTSSNIDLFIKACHSASAIGMSLRFYVIIRDKGLYPGKHGFDNLMLFAARNKRTENAVLSIWTDICELYYDAPPPWAYRTLLRALCYSKRGRGVRLFKKILGSAIERDYITEPTSAHWAWDSYMCAAKIKGYNWARSYEDVIQVMRDIKELEVPLIPVLLETCFMPNFSENKLEAYLPLLLNLLYETKHTLCAKSIKKGIMHSLYRTQQLAYNSGKRNFGYELLGKDISFDIDTSGEKVRRKVNETIATGLCKFILDDNYRFRISEGNSMKADIEEIQRVLHTQ